MSEAIYGGKRAATAYCWSGGEQLTAEEFRRLDVISQASYLATVRIPEREKYAALRLEDELGEPDGVRPGTKAWDEGPADWSNT